MDTVNERTTWIINAAFTDENGDDVIPSSGIYSVVDEKSGTELVSATAFATSEAYKNFEITPEQNLILDPRNRFEVRILTLDFVYNATRHGTAQYRWAVKNLDYIPMEESS